MKKRACDCPYHNDDNRDQKRSRPAHGNARLAREAFEGIPGALDFGYFWIWQPGNQANASCPERCGHAFPLAATERDNAQGTKTANRPDSWQKLIWVK